MKKLVLFGNGVFAEVLYAYIKQSGIFDVVGFTVDSAFLDRKEMFGLPVHAFEAVTGIWPPGQHDMIVAVGYSDLNRLRERKCREAKDAGYTLASFVYPGTTMFEGTYIGENTVILDNNTLQPNVQIGRNVLAWSGNVLGHHSIIGDHCCISSQVAVGGQVEMGTHCFVGGQASIKDGVKIGAFSVIGAGSAVRRDLPEYSVCRVQETRPSRVPSYRFKGI